MTQPIPLCIHGPMRYAVGVNQKYYCPGGTVNAQAQQRKREKQQKAARKPQFNEFMNLMTIEVEERESTLYDNEGKLQVSRKVTDARGRVAYVPAEWLVKDDEPANLSVVVGVKTGLFYQRRDEFTTATNDEHWFMPGVRGAYSWKEIKSYGVKVIHPAS